MQEADEAGCASTWFVTQDQTTAEFLDRAGTLAEGIYGLQDVPAADQARLDTFEQRLRDFAGAEEAGLFAFNAFDAYGNLAAPFGIEQARDGAWIRHSTIQADALD